MSALGPGRERSKRMAAVSPGTILLFGCPLSGEVQPISHCSDSTFSQGIVGDGVVILPTDAVLYSPADAKVDFSLKHALGLETEEGVKFLIHVGTDTNRLQGEGFQLFVQTGDPVKRGQKLLSFDPQVMKAHHCSLETPFVFCNCQTGWKLELLKTGQVAAGDDLVRLTALS